MTSKVGLLALCCLLSVLASTSVSAHWWRGCGWGGGWGNNGWGGGYRGWPGGPYNYCWGRGWGGDWDGDGDDGGWGGGGWGRHHRRHHHHHHRRSWWDVSDGSRITDVKKACTLYIEQYADDVVPADKLDEYIRKKFVGDASNTKSVKARQAQKTLKQSEKSSPLDKTEQFAPFVFQCCHVEFGKELLKNPTSPAATQYTAPPLPAGATCKTLTGELYKQLAGKA